jgi:predicted enzyme related to lactoylglutathione lyase
MLKDAFAMTTLPAEDLKRAIKFYTEVLGLKLIESPDDYSAVFEAGKGTKIFMYTRGRATAENTAATFQVPDLDATVKGLIAKGVKFEQYNNDYIKTNELGIAEMGVGPRVAWMTDPEGNILSVVERE